jgi:orotate phosphoribosyltransferase
VNKIRKTLEGGRKCNRFQITDSKFQISIHIPLSGIRNQESGICKRNDMTQDEVIKMFKQSEALLEGHFRLTSGLHSDRYLQCALVLQSPRQAEALGAALAARLRALGDPPDLVIAPALGGILVAHEVARALGVRGLFAERQDGILTLRRGFRIEPGEKAYVVEDVVTTGGSTKETMEVVLKAGAVVLAAGSLIDRSGGRTDLGVPRVALAVLDVPAFSPEECPLCKTGSKAIKPGSR